MMNILLALAIIAIPLAGYHAIVGAVIGLLQSIAVLLPLMKAPLFVKSVVGNNPMTADLVFSGLTAWGTATFFGTGLMLAVATATTAIILSLCLPRLAPA